MPTLAVALGVKHRSLLSNSVTLCRRVGRSRVERVSLSHMVPLMHSHQGAMAAAEAAEVPPETPVKRKRIMKKQAVDTFKPAEGKTPKTPAEGKTPKTPAKTNRPTTKAKKTTKTKQKQTAGKSTGKTTPAKARRKTATGKKKAGRKKTTGKKKARGGLDFSMFDGMDDLGNGPGIVVLSDDEDDLLAGFMDKLEDVDDSGVSDDDGNDMPPLQVIVESMLAQMSTSALFRLHENWDRLAKLEAVDTGSGCTGSGLDHYTVKTICKVLALEGILLRLAHACLL